MRKYKYSLMFSIRTHKHTALSFSLSLGMVSHIHTRIRDARCVSDDLLANRYRKEPAKNERRRGGGGGAVQGKTPPCVPTI